MDGAVEQGDALSRGAEYTVELHGLVKRYGSTTALDDVSLGIRPGEFFTLLGPSGCGKTTTLRSVAGFVTPDQGEVLIDAYLSPEVQLAFATELFFSPTNRTVTLPPDVAKKIINGPADVEKLLLFDWAHIAKQRPQWTERWNKEMR